MASSSKRDRLILASGSPRRRELLARAGVEFEVVVSAIAEVRENGEAARDYALRMAREKARAVAASFPDAFVIGADTVVECGGQIFEKPTDRDDARRMLGALSARTHTVTTGYAIVRSGSILTTGAVESRVAFRRLGSAEIDDYIASGEPFDKAGGYGIQGDGGTFIADVDGPRDNVMGLPVEVVLNALRQVGFGRC